MTICSEFYQLNFHKLEREIDPRETPLKFQSLEIKVFLLECKKEEEKESTEFRLHGRFPATGLPGIQGYKEAHSWHSVLFTMTMTQQARHHSPPTTYAKHFLGEGDIYIFIICWTASKSAQIHFRCVSLKTNVSLGMQMQGLEWEEQSSVGKDIVSV